MAAPIRSAERKKKLSLFADRDPRDGGSGMSASTKRHFDHVKRKMFAFVDRQNRRKTDAAMNLPAPLPFHPNRPPVFADQNRAPIFADRNRAPIFPDQNRAPNPRSHQPTPLLLHKQTPQFQRHTPPHRPVPPRAFATPQVHRRVGRPRSSIDARSAASVAFF